MIQTCPNAVFEEPVHTLPLSLSLSLQSEVLSSSSESCGLLVILCMCLEYSCVRVSQGVADNQMLLVMKLDNSSLSVIQIS